MKICSDRISLECHRAPAKTQSLSLLINGAGIDLHVLVFRKRITLRKVRMGYPCMQLRLQSVRAYRSFVLVAFGLVRPCMGFQSCLKTVAFSPGRRWRKVRRRISKGVLRKLDPLVAPAPSRWIHRFSCRKNKHEIQLFSPGDIAAVRSGIKGDPWLWKKRNFLPSGCNT